MKNLLITAFIVGLAAGVPAQKAAIDKDSLTPMTIRGCVAQSGAQYRLDHAMVATDPDSETQTRPATESSTTPKMISYILTGADVKAHVDHKVEVTGTLSRDTPQVTAGIKTIPGMKLAGTLNVKSVKMVSATCP
jgi:hypothetical protein